MAFRVASPEYLQTIGATLLAGRDFTAADGRDAPLVVIANETFARRHFGGVEQAIGKRVRLSGDGEPWREIVGVTADLQLHAWADVGTEMFFPLEQEKSFRDNPSPQYALTVVIRSSSGSAARELRRIVADLDPTIPVDRVVTLEAAVDQALWQPRLTAWVMGVFALLALALAGIGVYGTAAQAAARRRAEFGVRLALGATRRDVLALALGRSLRFVGAGVGVGFALAWGLSGLLRDLLYEVSARDGLAFAGACGLLALTGLLASYLPARRAAGLIRRRRCGRIAEPSTLVLPARPPGGSLPPAALKGVACSPGRFIRELLNELAAGYSVRSADADVEAGRDGGGGAVAGAGRGRELGGVQPDRRADAQGPAGRGGAGGAGDSRRRTQPRHQRQR